MADFTFRISPNIILGSYTTSRLGQFAKDWGSRYMVILDPILKEVGTSDKILQSLTDRKIDFFTFDEIPPTADTKTIERALALAKQSHIHGIIAAGGGKTLNVARAVASVFNEAHDLYAFVDGAIPTTSPIPLICVPTTIRDAFVFTDRTPVIDARSQQVKLLKSQNGLCKMVLFDPNLTVTLTENQTASMSLEAICLAVEAYVSQKASFFSDMLIEKSVELLGYALDGSQTLTVTTPQEVLLSQGGCMASLGSASSSLGAASLLALCINARYKISRSLVTSILLPYIIEDCAKFKTDRLAKLAQLLRIDPSAAVTADTANAAAPTQEQLVEALAENMRQRLAKANLPARLKDLSVSIEQLALAAEEAGHLDLMNTLPRSMTSDDLFDLIKLAY
jgi:alcohol dehydrogenase class IV